MKKDRVWLIGNIDSKDVSSIRTDLARYGFIDVNIYIPMVKRLSKVHRGKKVFDEVPMMLNFGFFSIEYDKVMNIEYLKDIRQKVKGIRFWVKDICNLDSFHGLATISDEDVVSMMKTQSSVSLFNDDIFNNVNIGKQITLKGYPYEGIIAEIIGSNKKKNQIKVKVEVNNTKLELDLDPENVFYTVYSDIDPDGNLKESYLEDSFNYTVDEIFCKIN